MPRLRKLVLISWFIFQYSWKIVCNSVLYMIFQYGLQPVLIHRILIGFEAILERVLYLSWLRPVVSVKNPCTTCSCSFGDVLGNKSIIYQGHFNREMYVFNNSTKNKSLIMPPWYLKRNLGSWKENEVAGFVEFSQ